MTDLEELYEYADEHDIDVDFCLLNKAQSLSAPLFDGSCAIAIDPTKMSSTADEKWKLAHEMGHCETGAFYTQASNLTYRMQCEVRADRWAIKKLLPFDEMREAMRQGYATKYELAEYFNVSEEAIDRAYSYYTNSRGLSFEG